MSFSGESEGEEEGGGTGGITFHILKFSWHPNLGHWTRYRTYCVIVFLMHNVLVSEIGREGGVALGKSSQSIVTALLYQIIKWSLTYTRFY